MRFQRTCGLDSDQLDELEDAISTLLPGSWDSGTGRPKELTLREAIVVACAYLRHNIVQQVLAEFFDASQSTISRMIKEITPFIDAATEKFRPRAEDAREVIKGTIALVDGALWPCWSWRGNPELWAGKYKTTGHGGLIISTEAGNVAYVTEPAPGCDHDMRKLKESPARETLAIAGAVIGDKGFEGSGYVTPIKKPKGGELLLTEQGYNNQISSLRAPVERAVANIKTWRILHTDYRRPLETFLTAFRAAIGLYFFKLTFE